MLKSLSDTRWSARAEATKALSEGYDNIRAALLHIAQDPEQRADTQQLRSYNGLHISLSYLDTVFMAVFWNIILKRFNRVSMALQSAKIELGTAVKLLYSHSRTSCQNLEGTLMLLRCVRNKRIQVLNIRMPKKRIRKPKTQFGDESNGLVLHQHDKFRIEVFLPILDKLSQALTLRTQAYDVVHKRFGFITEFRSMGADEIEKAAQNLKQCYPNDLELSFPQEFKHFSCFIERLNSDKEMPACTFTCTAINLYSIIFNHCLQSTFLNVEIAYQMYLSLMAINASGERSFSKLRLIKNEKRTCMHQDRLN